MTLDERFNFGLMLIREVGPPGGYFNNRDKLTIQNKGPQDLASEADLNTELRTARSWPKRFRKMPSSARKRRPPLTATVRASGWSIPSMNAALHLRPHQLVRVDCFRARRRVAVRHGLCAGARRTLCRRQGLSGDPQWHAHHLATPDVRCAVV